MTHHGTRLPVSPWDLPAASQAVEPRFFGGLVLLDIATALEVSGSTVQREWRVPRA